MKVDEQKFTSEVPSDSEDDPINQAYANLVIAILFYETTSGDQIPGTGPTRKLTPPEVNFLRVVANPFYPGDRYGHVKRELDMSDRYARYVSGNVDNKLTAPGIFGAVAIALDKGIISIEDVLGEEVDRLSELEDSVWYVRPEEKQTLFKAYELAVSHNNTDDESMGEALKVPADTIHSRRNRLRKKLGNPNKSQFAFYAHLYATRMRTPIQEILLVEQIEVLEAAVSMDNLKFGVISHIAEVLGITEYNARSRLSSACTKLGVNNVVEVVCKAIDLGQRSLLREVGFDGFQSLTELTRDEVVALNSLGRLRLRDPSLLSVRSRFNFYNDAQAAPFVYLSRKRVELGLLHSD